MRTQITFNGLKAYRSTQAIKWNSSASAGGSEMVRKSKDKAISSTSPAECINISKSFENTSDLTLFTKAFLDTMANFSWISLIIIAFTILISKLF
jgi:hypothetical protein